MKPVARGEAQEVADTLRQQVDKLTSEPCDNRRKAYRLPGDAFVLRGLPMIGRDMLSGAIPGSTPGSDAHLEQLG